MAQIEQLRKGMVIRHEGQLYTVMDFHVAQSGKQKPTVHVKLRAVRDGRQADRTLDQLGTIDEVSSEVRDFQYLYASGRERVFMDLETYDQHSLHEDQLGEAVHYLVEEQPYRFLVVEGRPAVIQLPPTIAMQVVDTAPPEHAGGGSSVYKEARLASGRMIMVPLFIKTGDFIRINTVTGEYQGKEGKEH